MFFKKKRNVLVPLITILLPNSPDLNPVDFGIWRLLEQNVCQGRRRTDLHSLKEATVEEWNEILQKITANQSS